MDASGHDRRDWHSTLAEAEADAHLTYALLHPDGSDRFQLPEEVPAGATQLCEYIQALQTRLEYLQGELVDALRRRPASPAAAHAVPVAAPRRHAAVYVDRRL